MPKNGKSGSKKKKSVSTKKVVNPRLTYLELLMEVTLRQIDGKSESLDELFKNQYERIKKEFEELKYEKRSV
jgi:hypothetical protein